MNPKIFSFLLGVTYGIGLYIVGDYLLFHQYDPVAGAESILEDADDGT